MIQDRDFLYTEESYIFRHLWFSRKKTFDLHFPFHGKFIFNATMLTLLAVPRPIIIKVTSIRSGGSKATDLLMQGNRNSEGIAE